MRGGARAERGRLGAGLEVVILERQRRQRVDRRRLRGVLARVAQELRVGGSVVVVLAGDGLLRGLNRRYRGKDRPTDVLSFDGPGGEEGLGDIVISVATAARNARRLGRTLAEELDLLVLHGLLHLRGHDHETDGGRMERLEARLRRLLLPPARASR